ncbi:MAG: DUF4962 domain-containing protein [Minwuia sp.]|uniref:DUF4962 domain-containing protein n=1 Tax=Minwuia sp. TaxID=2493630 RepID=UPI003A89C7E7
MMRRITLGLFLFCMSAAFWTGHAEDRPDPWLYYIETLPETNEVSDWLSPETALEMPVYPFNEAVVVQNPPVFRWRYGGEDLNYEVEIEALDGQTETVHRITEYNHLQLNAPLAQGPWRWRARRWHDRSGAEGWSGWRNFRIHEKAHVFVAPSVQEAWERATAARHPRSFPGKEGFNELRRDLRQGERKPIFADVLKNVGENFINGELDPEPPTATFEVEDFYERIRVAKFIAQVVNKATVQLGTTVYTYHLTRDEAQMKEAWRRAMVLASWDPDHSTGVRSSDLSNLRIALALALVYDITHKHMDEATEAELRRMIEYRTQAAFDEYVVNPRRALEFKPYNSHGFRQAGAVTAIASLMAKDTPRARNWFFRTYPIYLAVNNPWGGEDGGFGNGVNYGIWDAVNNMHYWDIIRNAIGVDPAQMGWPKQAGVFFSYLVPPGTPNSAFGDGGENHFPDIWALVAMMYRQRIDTPISRRFASQWEPERQEFYLHLYGPLYEQPERPFLAASHPDLPDTAIFPSIGWVVMHSELDDPERYSILFKSSPYGSFSHSHADQNSFIINGRRESLAIDSGYYDTWKSKHHLAWTMQTKAHNAITFDGGQGQPEQERAAQGKITNFARCSGHDMATGDATAAYMGALTKAKRTIAHIRPGMALIHDDLASDEPRTWEWNLHAWEAIIEEAPGRLKITKGEGQACFRVLAAPDFTTSQTDAFPEDPDPFFVPDWKNQWHVTLATTEKSTEAQFLVAVDLGCTGAEFGEPEPLEGGGFRVLAGNNAVEITGDGAVVTPLGPVAAGAQCPIPAKKVGQLAAN